MNTEVITRAGPYKPKSFDDAQVNDAMHPGVLTCPPETPLATVALMMARYRVHAIVVTDLEAEGEGEQPWRVVSDLDLAGAAAAGRLSDLTAGGVAATEVLTIGSKEPLREAARVMTEHAVSHLVVITPRSATPVGVISTLDLAAAMPRQP